MGDKNSTEQSALSSAAQEFNPVWGEGGVAQQHQIREREVSAAVAAAEERAATYQLRIRDLERGAMVQQHQIRDLEARGKWLEDKKDLYKEKYTKSQSHADVIQECCRDLTKEKARFISEAECHAGRILSLESEKNGLLKTRSQLEEQVFYLEEDRQRNEARLHTTVTETSAMEVKLRSMIDNLRQEAADQDLSKWHKPLFQYEYVFEEISKIGCLPKDHRDWIDPMIEMIEIPPCASQIRRKYRPSCDDAHMISADPDEETALYTRLSEEASAFSELVGPDPRITRAAATLIQKIMRGHFTRKKLQRDNECKDPQTLNGAATLIQKAIRGWKSRGISTHKALWPGCARYRRTPNIPADIGIGRINVRFITTGPNACHIRWIDHRQGNRPSASVSTVKVADVNGFSVSTFGGHWFRVDIIHNSSSVEDPQHMFVRIPFDLKSGGYFDIHTRTTLNARQWGPTRREYWFDRKFAAEQWGDLCQCPRCLGQRGYENSQCLSFLGPLRERLREPVADGTVSLARGPDGRMRAADTGITRLWRGSTGFAGSAVSATQGAARRESRFDDDEARLMIAIQMSLDEMAPPLDQEDDGEWPDWSEDISELFI